MKIPRDISSDELIKLLNNLDYKVSCQIGSHIRLTSKLKGGVHHYNTTEEIFKNWNYK